MGACGAKTNLPMDGDEGKSAYEDDDDEDESVKLLLLGAGESGKSTILKQMKLLHGKGFDDERKDGVILVRRNIRKNIEALTAACEKFGITVGAQDALAAFRAIDKDQDNVEPSKLSCVKELWADAGVQEAFKRRSEFQLADNAPYFFGRMDDVLKDSYLPTNDDMLNMRTRTTGRQEYHFVINNRTFIIQDVGGQRSERLKWIKAFAENIDAVLFIAGLSGYDQVLYEEEKQNRMVEALELFQMLVGCGYLDGCLWILFLNKWDLFEEKIASVDIRQPKANGGQGLFMDYDGGCDKEKGFEYFKEKFVVAANGKPVRTHKTTATDTDLVDNVFDSCKDFILEELVRRAFDREAP